MNRYDLSMTLDPPGTIAVVGAGPLGIEAALYGRFLGYDVTLFEKLAVGHSILSRGDGPLPMLPGRCLSPLAMSALQAQADHPAPIVLPQTSAAWVDAVLVPLTESDLLAGRLRAPAEVQRITRVPIEPEADDEPESDPLGEIPHDFRLWISDSDQQLDVEAVILAVGESSAMECDFGQDQPYFFIVGGEPDASETNAEQRWLNELHRIVDIFASLAGRADLDLYRPKRS